MYPIGVVGPGSKRCTERLAEGLSRDGTVGVISAYENDESRSTDGGVRVESSDLDRYRAAGATVVYERDANGWQAFETDRNLQERIYALATNCQFVIVEGTSTVGGRELPSVVLGSDTADPDAVLARASGPEGLEIESIRSALTETEPIETLESLIERVKDSPRAQHSGAIATFTGRVRAKENNGDTTTEYLEFEKYKGVAEDRMARISADLETRDGVYEVLLHHRTGRIGKGEDIVFVVVLAGHRAEAFRTVEDGIDRLKADVPIFKKEVTVDEEFWVHDRP